MNKIDSSKLYISFSFLNSFIFSLIFTVNLIYHVNVVKLSPLQLVFIGTILESSVFIFEIPTGIIADLKSRKFSIIIGILITGVAFLIEGLFPYFIFIAISKILWGLGFTCISGASEAWIADEVGEEKVQNVFIKGARAANLGGFIAIPLSVYLGIGNIQIPIIAGGVLFIIMGLILPIIMKETDFKPVDFSDRNSFNLMYKSLKGSLKQIKAAPILLVLLLVGFFFGLYSEGYDRLWTPHILGSFIIPDFGTGNPIIFFGIIRAITQLISFIILGFINKKVDKFNQTKTSKILIVVVICLIFSLISFGYINWLWGALIFYWIIGILKNVNYPLFNAWFNHNIKDSKTRATLFSVSSQFDSIGQIIGGPITGSIAKFISIPFAMLICGLLLLPVIPLYYLVKRLQKKD
ncbi:MAG: MFS transporter [Spirochaetaceae bacterium]